MYANKTVPWMTWEIVVASCNNIFFLPASQHPSSKRWVLSPWMHLVLCNRFQGCALESCTNKKACRPYLWLWQSCASFNCLGHSSLVGQDASGGLLVRILRWKGKPQCFQPNKTWRQWSYRDSKPDFRCSYCSVGWCMVGVYRDDITDWIKL